MMKKRKTTQKKSRTISTKKKAKKEIPKIKSESRKRKTKPWVIGGFILAMIAVLFEIILLLFGQMNPGSVLYKVLSPITYPGAAIINGFTSLCALGESESGPVVICPESYQLFSMAATLVIIVLIYFCIGAVIGWIFGKMKR